MSHSPHIRITQHQPQDPHNNGRDRLGSLLEDVARNQKSRFPRRWWWIIGLAALLVIVLGVLFIRAQLQLKKLQNSPEQNQQNQIDAAALQAEQNKQLIEQVGKLIILPKDEQPTIATVSDLSKLAGQPFFAKAQVGDKVLIYQQDKKAILYRPSTNQIIELAPLINGTNTPAAPTNTAPTPPAQ